MRYKMKEKGEVNKAKELKSPVPTGGVPAYGPQFQDIRNNK